MYGCGGNLMWVDPQHNPLPGMTPTKKQVQNYINHYLNRDPAPHVLPHTIVIAVMNDANPLELGTSILKRCSPEEP